MPFAPWPERWREIAAILLAPIAWIPRLQARLIDVLVDAPSGLSASGKSLLLALPILVVLIAIWSTQLSVYTLPFRRHRLRFVSTLLVAWWDAALAVLMYWIGLVRFAVFLVTLICLLAKHTFHAAIRFVFRPVSTAVRSTDPFGPGVPWVAVGLLVVWCVLEATLFTYTVLPSLLEALADVVGEGVSPRATAAVLWFFLFLLAMGSFVCIQVLVEAVKTRALAFIVLCVLVELFVMFFEVVFLYRPFAEAITPWIVQQTGETLHPGAWFTFSVARFGWTGVRGMGWFLFGQYGTPPLLRLLSRRAGEEPAPEPAVSARSERPSPLAPYVAWLRDERRRLLEYVGLPLLHLVAAVLNFVMVLVAGERLFRLPFRHLAEALARAQAGEEARGADEPVSVNLPT